MRFDIPLGVFLIAALSALGVAACNATVEDGKTCAATCGDENPKGLRYYNNVMATCACETCSDDCKQSVCRDKEAPGEACLPCVQEALSGPPCNEHSGLFGSGCFGHSECRTYVSCLEACR